MEHWRLIIHPPYSGAWNMAVDEAILESVAQKLHPPTLRLYDWHPYSLSLGLAQPFSDVDTLSLAEKGWDIVRRPTGGRAILHADEITYSICAPDDDAHVSRSVLESYRILSTGLLKALQAFNIQADSKPKPPQDRQKNVNPVCFQSPSDYEITFQGKKLIGSAQARRLHGVLQHGAIPLFGDITRIITVLNYPTENARVEAKIQLQQYATNMVELLGRKLAWQEAADALILGFQDALDIQFHQGNLSPEEKTTARQLYLEKYNNVQWTKRI